MGICRPCDKEYKRIWHQKNKHRRNPIMQNQKRARRQESERKLYAYMKEHPCVDCGETDILVLEFDHKNPEKKRTEIAILLKGGYSFKTIKKEIDKCDVRCANCHKRKTHRDNKSWRYKISEGVSSNR